MHNINRFIPPHISPMNYEIDTNISINLGNQNIEDKGFSYILSIINYNNNDITTFNGSIGPIFNNLIKFLNTYEEKEDLYICAIDNLNRKNNYLQLTIQLDQDLITEEEFELELEENEYKYLIKINENFKNDYIRHIADILPKSNLRYSNDDVSEMFSIPLEKVNKYLLSLDK